MTNPEAEPPTAAPRLTPYEIVFTQGDFESRVFPRIREEATAEGVASLHRERFEFLSTAGDVLREVTPEDAPPEALEQYRLLLFHAFHHWNEGRSLYVLDTAASRFLVESQPDLSEWQFTTPTRSLYLQLPANLFWSSISPEVPPEPVDGFFVTTSTGEDLLGKPFQKLEILVILGIRRSRAGFSVIPVESELGPGIAPPWEGEERGGGDFANVLPGGEIQGLYSMLTTGEVLKLVARAFWYIDSFPEAVVLVEAAEPPATDEDPRTTQLPYTHVTLAAGGRPATDE